MGAFLSATVCAHAAPAASVTADRNLLDAEETYELRLLRLMNAKGKRALVDFLARELAERPRPYVKAWYANYLLYGSHLGLEDISDTKRGFILAKEARDEGSLFGLELVGRAYGDGIGPENRDVAEAVKCLTEATRLGRDSSMAEMAKYYFFGSGVPLDRNKAEELARRAAWLGATAGLTRLAEWWEEPKYVGTPDPAKALALYYEAAQMGVGSARTKLKERAERGDPLAEKYLQLDQIVSAKEGAVAYPTRLRAVVKSLDASAAPDDFQVQIALAELMIEKLGPVYNPKAAREKLTRAANAGHGDARDLLAQMAWRGIGEKADPAGAIAVWRELAAQDNARGLNSVGWLHWWGNGAKYGVEKDAAKAFALCRRSADLGFWIGQRNVADCYAHGIGTEVNYYLAAKYYQIIEQRGFIRGRDMKQRMLAAVKD